MANEYRYLSVSLSQPSNSRHLHWHQVTEYYTGKNLDSSPLFQVLFIDGLVTYITKRITFLEEVVEYKEETES